LTFTAADYQISTIQLTQYFFNCVQEFVIFLHVNFSSLLKVFHDSGCLLSILKKNNFEGLEIIFHSVTLN